MAETNDLPTDQAEATTEPEQAPAAPEPAPSASPHPSLEEPSAGRGPCGPSPEDPPDPATALAGTLRSLTSSLEDSVARIFHELHSRHTADRFKEGQIDRLHQELQAYKSDAAERPVRQLLLGVVRLHDDLGKATAALRQRPSEELTPEVFFRHFDDLRDDIELLLGQHGVEPFEAPGDCFDPHRQTALRTVTTPDATLTGQIAGRLRPGFQQGDRLLQKERVAVYVAPAPSPQPASGGSR